ncbi:hypothetical protein [Sphingopyxis sp.]|jgi:hypothetical protein|uniref:hypothetical protein n=1 Tax=Sphingopyxis sp. TaxID=1908224 RepID=UPI003F70E520
MTFDKEEQFDRLLTLCENLILDMRERDVATELDANIDESAQFIAAALTGRGIRKPDVMARAAPRHARTRVAVPRDATGRRRLLGRLIATRSNLPDRISLAFAARQPDDEEIADMLDEILRDVEGPANE